MGAPREGSTWLPRLVRAMETIEAIRPEQARFGALLKRFRLAAGLSQEALAERAGLSVQAIGAYERGLRQAPYRDTLRLLADALRLTADEAATLERAVPRRRSPVGMLAESPAPLIEASPDPPPRTLATQPGMSPPGRIPPPLVDRVHELPMLERHLAGEGPPLLFLAGEPGIGKSRLLRETAARATRSGMQVLSGGCTRQGGQEPYAPLLEAIELHIRAQPPVILEAALRGCAWLVRLLPELAAGPIEPLPTWTIAPQQERRLVFAAVARYLANVAGPTGVVLLLDDLQWAGADALDLLATLARMSADVPVRVVCAYRDAEIRAGMPLAVLLADLAHADLAAHHLLAPLSAPEAARLFEALMDGEETGGELRDHVVRQAGGVPFFVVSYARGLQFAQMTGAAPLGVPWSVAQSIRQRVATLPAQAREVLGVAAVAGRVVPGSLLRDVESRPEADVPMALEVICRARLLLEDGEDTYRFAHDVTREVVEADLHAARRATLHRRIAESLEARPGEPPVDLLAYHYGRCGDQDRAIHYLEQAGDRARGQAAHDAAADYYHDVAARLDRLGRAVDAAGVREKLADVLATSARYDEALAVLDEAAIAMDAAGDLDGLGRLAAQMGHCHYHRGTLEEGVARLLPLLERLETRGPSVALAMAYSALAELNLNWGHWAQEVAAAERAGEIARLVGDDRVLARASWLRGMALILMSQDEQAIPVLQETITLAEAIHDLESLSQTLNSLASLYAEHGEFTLSISYAERAFQAAEKLGNPVLMADTLIGRGVLACFGGEWDRAHGYYDRAGALHRQVSIAPSACEAGGLLLCQGQLRLHEGAWEEAYRCMEEGRVIFAPQGKRAGLRFAQGLLAEYDILTGRPASAQARLLPLLDRAGVEEGSATISVLPTLAWAHLELGDVDQANHVITEAIRRLRASGCRLTLVDALRVRALVALRQEHWPAAEGAIGEGLALARAIPYPYGEGRLLALHQPAAWAGRTVLLRGGLQNCPFYGIPMTPKPCMGWQLSIADKADPAVELPITEESPDPVLAFLRRLPVLGGIVPAPRELRWDVPATYRVRLEALTNTQCGPTVCYAAVLLDTQDLWGGS